jgi:hypothetical protein
VVDTAQQDIYYTKIYPLMVDFDHVGNLKEISINVIMNVDEER